MIFADGVVATGGTPASGSIGAIHRFPAHLRPSAVAITTNNEFVLVTLWWEDRVAIVDLGPLLGYFRSMYFGDVASCGETLSQFVWDGSQPGDQVLAQARPTCGRTPSTSATRPFEPAGAGTGRAAPRGVRGALRRACTGRS